MRRSSASTREELGRIERDREAIVSAALETKHAIQHQRFGGEHQNCSIDASLPQIATDLKSTSLRKHRVQDNERAVALQRLIETRYSVARERHRITLAGEKRGDCERKLGVVFDEKNI
jgi:hypothetical protein